MPTSTQFGDLIARRMHAEHEALAARWFQRLVDLLPVDARHVFPSNSLLDHVPALIRDISGSLRPGEDGAIAANTNILDKARELGALRHQQRASLHQILREYQLLGGVLVQFVLQEVEQLTIHPPAPACVFVVSRIHHAVDVLSQTTVEAFVSLYTQTISDQTERLQQFTRMATHEWRQPLGAVQFGVSVLRQAGVGDRATRTLDVIERNVAHLVDMTRKLEAVARLHASADTVVTQTLPLSTIAREAARQLRDMSELRGVDIRIAEATPEISVDVGRLELTLLNLFSNSIKYADPAKPERFVELSASTDAVVCRIVVRDNGIGIPQHALGSIFQRFTRAHTTVDSPIAIDGVGLGLSIVDDCVRAMGGRIEVESLEGAGTTFVVVLPVLLEGRT
jgi:signal transduction histidine kinase